MSTEVCNEIFYLQRQLAQAQAVIAEQKETIDSLNALAKFDNETVESAIKCCNEQSELIEKLASALSESAVLIFQINGKRYEFLQEAFAAIDNWKENK